MKKTQKTTPPNPDTITVTLGQLVTCGRSTLITLEQTRMPGKMSYELARLVRDARKEIEAFEAEQLKLYQKHGVSEDAGGGNIRYRLASDEAIAAFNAEIQGTIDAEITLLHKKMPWVLDYAQLTPAEAVTLEWLIGQST